MAHFTRDTEKQCKAEWGTPLELAHGSSNARGVAILLRNGFDCKIKQNYLLILPVDMLVFKHKLMTKTVIYSPFSVQTTIIKLHNLGPCVYRSEKRRSRL